MTRIYMINFSWCYLFSEYEEAEKHPDWNSKGCLEKEALYDKLFRLDVINATEFDKEFAKLEKLVSAAEKKWGIMKKSSYYRRK